MKNLEKMRKCQHCRGSKCFIL